MYPDHRVVLEEASPCGKSCLRSGFILFDGEELFGTSTGSEEDNHNYRCGLNRGRSHAHATQSGSLRSFPLFYFMTQHCIMGVEFFVVPVHVYIDYVHAPALSVEIHY